MIHFDSAGEPSIESLEWRSFLARTLESLGNVLEIVSHLRIDVGDHAMAGYRGLVQKNQDALAALLQ